ncbi:hypothetical protein [Paenibacillus agilis]|uniref:Uncharacterized protein n=1 Tax=Paenibacillus agilis TaxID=3020863 RepID=A0A559IDE3_9BACL|nr:hypothetical protein [Paenibacillus agilis]TVX85550.1 hypothetical protein FPZ44_24650 [Paenibacillus agilis]
MVVYQMHYILLGVYDVVFDVEAKTDAEASTLAIQEMKKDRIYHEDSTVLYQVSVRLPRSDDSLNIF